MAINIEKTATSQRSEEFILDVVEKGSVPTSLRALLDEFDRAKIDPMQARRSLWDLIDEHRLQLGPDNSLTLTKQGRCS